MQRWCRHSFFFSWVECLWFWTNSCAIFILYLYSTESNHAVQHLTATSPDSAFPRKKLGRGQFQVQFSSHKNAYISIFLWRLKEFLGLGKGGGIKVHFTPHKTCRRLFTKGPSLTAIRDSPEAEISEEEGCSEGKVCFFTAHVSHPTCVHHNEMLS